jgi:hypothetical protein
MMAIDERAKYIAHLERCIAFLRTMPNPHIGETLVFVMNYFNHGRTPVARAVVGKASLPGP